jgi:poly(3-hydroxyoctanoate) depolymerase
MTARIHLRPRIADEEAVPLAGITPTLRHERYTEIRGHRLRISVEGHGPPLLLINGLAANMELWQPLRARLPGRQTIAFDPPGIGGSPRSPVRLRMDDLAEIVGGLLSELGHDAVDVLGYSLGGAIAQQFARHYPQRVRRLVLAASTPGLGSIQNPLVVLDVLALAMRRNDRRREATLRRLVAGQVSRDPDALQWVERAHRTWPASRSGIADQLLGLTGWTSVPWLHTISNETLVLAAEHDPLVPRINGRIFTSRMPSCRLYVVPGAGHLFLIDQAPDAAELIDAFLTDQRRIGITHRIPRPLQRLRERRHRRNMRDGQNQPGLARAPARTSD